MSLFSMLELDKVSRAQVGHSLLLALTDEFNTLQIYSTPESAIT